jgi:hypothetical protein
MTIKEYVIKDEPAFRLRIKQWKAVRPDNLNSIEFIQECMRDGEVDFASTYNFLLTDEEIKTLIKGLENIIE